MTYLIVIPAYNAAPDLAHVLRQLGDHRHRLVVVDDGSTDDTPAIARSFADVVLTHDRNRGVGAAIRTGMGYARGHGYDRLVTLDADGQHQPWQVEEFLRALTDNDLVVGSRFLLDAEHVHDAKLAANLLAALIVNDAFDVRLSDVACGYRAFWRPDPGPLRRVDGWGFLYEHLIGSLAEGRRVATIPVPAVYRPSTLWATRALEIEGFLAAMVRHAPAMAGATDLGRAARAVARRQDFMYEVRGQVFHCFYVGTQDCYLVQTDMKAARAVLSGLRATPGRPPRQPTPHGPTPAAGP
jgi:glycosyltransferase involved in cell wall biosynthesis